MARSKGKEKGLLQKIWYFLWYDDGALSWIANVVLAFVLIKFIVFPGLGWMLGTQFPIVAVISGSMDHDLEGNLICGKQVDDNYQGTLEDYWSVCGSWYKDKGITRSEFQNYPLSLGFKRGDIIVLRGKKPEDINRGEIIVFKAKDQNRKPDPIIHRVVEVHGDNTFTTKGDHNPSSIADSIIGEDNIDESRLLGISLFRVPYLGYVKIIAVEFVQKIARGF